MTAIKTAEKAVSDLFKTASQVESQGDFSAAEELFKAAKTLTKKLLGVKHLLYVDCLHHLALCLNKQTDSVTARDYAIKALEVLNGLVDEDKIHSEPRWEQLMLLLHDL